MFSDRQRGHRRAIRSFRPAVERLEKRCVPAVTLHEFQIPTAQSLAEAITAGPDGNLWFTEAAANQIGRITPAGSITLFPAASVSTNGPTYITAGPDGNLWFTEDNSTKIGRITTTGQVTEFTLNSSVSI